MLKVGETEERCVGRQRPLKKSCLLDTVSVFAVVVVVGELDPADPDPSFRLLLPALEKQEKDPRRKKCESLLFIFPDDGLRKSKL